MQFAQPLWLVAGAAACALLVWQFRRYDRRQKAALAQFAASRLLNRLTASVSTPRRRVKRVLYAAGVGLLFVALARPQAGFEWQQTHRKGLELIFAVDTSKSMLAQDVKPDRLTRAKLGVTDLVTKLNGDGVGLVAFAGNAFLQCPITLDYDAFRESLDALDVNVIPRGGTNIAAAIREAEAVFKTRTAAEKILVLITDGEDLGGEGVTAAQTAAKNGVKIFTIGVGNTTGELVPVPSENGGTEFAKDERGGLVKSRLDEATLRKIAEATGGMYQPLGTQGEGLAMIYEQGLSSFARQDLSSRQAKVPLEKFHWALLAALACFVADQLIGTRRKDRTLRTRRAAKSANTPRPHTTAAALILLGGIACTQAATPQSAEQAFQNGDFAKAQQEYAATAAKEPAKAELHFNTGAAAYKAGDYAQAASGFQQSLKTEQVPVQQGAYFNLGNTQYRLGQKTEKTSAQETIKTWEEAVKSYDAALQIKPDDADAKHNRDLVQRKIEQLKKQEEQKQQDQKDQQQKQDNEDQKSDSNDQSNKDQDSGSKDQQQNEQQGDKSQQDQSKGEDDAKDKKDGAADQKYDGGKDDQKKNPGDASKEQKDDPKEQRADGQPKPGDEQKDQAPQADAKSGKDEQPKPVDPAEKPSKGEAQAAHGEQPQNEQALAAPEERREPGQLTKEEAKQLLDALKNDERKAPAISQQGRAGSQPNDRRILKDW